MKEIELKVKGMVCAGCENRVKNVLQNIEGVEKVEASHTESLVKVTLKEDIERKTIEDAIRDLGYDVESEK